MAIPENIFEESAQLTYDEGYWTATYKGKPFDLYPGAAVLAWDDRVETWANAMVQGFERDKVLVVWEDGFRFLFTAERAAIRPKERRGPDPDPQPPPPDAAQLSAQAFGEGYQAAISDLMAAVMARFGRLEAKVEESRPLTTEDVEGIVQKAFDNIEIVI